MVVDAALALLLDAQNEDGGWSSFKGKRSNTESTSFALLSLNTLEGDPFARQKTTGLKWLLRHQKDDGSWSFNDAAKQSSWATPIAALALTSFRDQRQTALKAAKWILTQEGRKPGWVASLLVRLSL